MKTELIKIDAADIDAARIAAAAKVLDEGGFVAFPTETVYGIGCAAQADAIARLDELKGRPADKRYTLHIGDKEEVFRYVPRIAPYGRKLIANAWPGPVTIVFELSSEDLKKQKAVVGIETFDVLYSGGTLGVRCVDNEIARRLLDAAQKPVVAPSANLSGAKPATTVDEVMATFEGRIGVVIEVSGGACGSGMSSTVVRIGKLGREIRREGAVSAERIAELSEIRILFVCTGNTCRSPMAEGFCRKILSEKLNCSVDAIGEFGYKVGSAGVMTGGLMPASSEGVDICRRKGVDISGHRSRYLECDEVMRSDFVFVMSRSHQRRIEHMCPEAVAKCMLLDAGGDIQDPIGGDVEVYEECAKQIETALKKRISEIWYENSGSK